MQIIGDEENGKRLASARKEQWGNLRDASREAFLDQRQPGARYEEALSTGGNDNSSCKMPPPPSNFLLLLLWPTEVKYLKLGSGPDGEQYAQHDILTDGTNKNGGVVAWKSERVNP